MNTEKKWSITNIWTLCTILFLVLGGSGLGLFSFNQFATKEYVNSVHCELMDFKNSSLKLNVIINEMKLKYKLLKPYEAADLLSDIENDNYEIKKLESRYFKKCLENE